MGEVIDMFSRKKKQEVKSEEPATDLDAIAEENKKKLEARTKQRAQHNENVFKSYRMK